MKSYWALCGKTCLVCLLIRLIFFRAKSNELTDQQDRFASITHMRSVRTNNTIKLLMNNKFKAQTVNRKSYRKLALPHLASRALNMSYSFGKSARLIESKAVRGNAFFPLLPMEPRLSICVLYLFFFNFIASVSISVHQYLWGCK